MKDDRLYLIYILECIDRVERYTADGQTAFFADLKTQDAVLRNLQVLAESTQRLSIALKDAAPKVDWVGIAGFRNILVHNYLGINMVRVWEIVQNDLPELKRQVRGMFENLDQSPST